MGIEFGQIHNLVRTYQRILDVPSGKDSLEEQTLREAEDRISISAQARRQGAPSRPDPLADGFSQQDKERPL